LRYCSGDDEPRDWSGGVSYGASWTRLRLTANSATTEAVFRKQAVTASVERRVGDRWTLGGMLGSTTTGTLDAYGQSFALSAGPLAAFVASFRALDEGTVRPFVLLSGSLGASLSWTSAANQAHQAMTGIDARLGVAAGKTIAHALTPYLVARAFGGPILWSNAGASVVGTDVYHYQLGAGAVLRLGRFDLLVEGVPLGEQALVGGAGMAF
jgi:hypothetical protein